MVWVNQDFCVGCGNCIDSCPQAAVLFQSGKAWIDQKKCTECSICLKVCPCGAIIESYPSSPTDLALTVDLLKQKADDLIERIDKLKRIKSV